jgi:sugar/nucleoside kinase (ribokinase family)
VDEKYDLMVFGEPMVQYTIRDCDIVNAKLENPGVGGSDVFVAATLAKCGLNSGLYSVIAQDPYENLIRETLKKNNIKTNYSLSDMGHNGIEIISDSDNESREFFYNRPGGCYNPLPSELNMEMLDNCKTIYASSGFTLSSEEARSFVFESFYYAHYSNKMVSFDPNLRMYRHNLSLLRETIWMLLPFIDFFSISVASKETIPIFGTDNPRVVASILLEKKIQYAAVRNAGESVFFGYLNDERDMAPTIVEIPVKKIEGSGYFSHSGAVFNGAFIAAILKWKSPLEAVRYAIDCATQKCMRGNKLDSIFCAEM